MKKIVFTMLLVLVTAGCGKNESAFVGTEPQMDQRKEIGRKLILKSMTDLQNKDLKTALADLEASIKINPSEPEAYMFMGQVLLKVNEPDHAIDFLEGAVKAFPNNGTMFYMLGLAHQIKGDKLPATLATRRSVELFQAEGDKDNMLKAVSLLQDLINMPDQKVTTDERSATKQDAMMEKK